jgi:hypothetical protein
LSTPYFLRYPPASALQIAEFAALTLTQPSLIRFLVAARVGATVGGAVGAGAWVAAGALVGEGGGVGAHAPVKPIAARPRARLMI